MKLESLINQEAINLALNKLENSSKEFEKFYNSESLINIIDIIYESFKQNNYMIINRINS